MIYNKETLDKIKDILVSKNQTVAVAESVTSGLLQAAFSNATDASCFFQGGITAYNLGQKCRHLSVEPVHASACNCVSETVSAQMAKEVSRMFLSDYGIGVTGFATPVPEKNIKRLFACFAISYKGAVLLSENVQAGGEKAFEAQVFFTEKILESFLKLLSDRKS